MLHLEKNKLTGSIPQQMAMLPSIAEVDLSENSLTGGVPSSFSITLEYFNISFNSLTGPIPSSGLFKILDPSSYAGNENLCGSLLAKPCTSAGENEPEARHQQPKKITVTKELLPRETIQ
ncbi:MDIS1-interacting receptor like kinase [Trifolium repens]|jgi:hypothetical protein|nr:MDIS1-interacting receptor like kinase [Trifolium repens]